MFNSLNLAHEVFGTLSPWIYKSAKSIEAIKDLPGQYAALFHWADDRGSILWDGPRSPQTPTYCKGSWIPHPKNVAVLDRSELAEHVWTLGTLAGDVVTRSTQPHLIDGYTIDLDACEKVLANRSLYGLPNQAAGILQFLLDNGYDFYTKSEMRDAVITRTFFKRVRTKQNPWRIFRYYRPRLQELGCLIKSENLDE